MAFARPPMEAVPGADILQQLKRKNSHMVRSFRKRNGEYTYAWLWQPEAFRQMRSKVWQLLVAATDLTKRIGWYSSELTGLPMDHE